MAPPAACVFAIQPQIAKAQAESKACHDMVRGLTHNGLRRDSVRANLRPIERAPIGGRVRPPYKVITPTAPRAAPTAHQRTSTSTPVHRAHPQGFAETCRQS